MGPGTPTFTQVSYKPDDLNSRSYPARRRWERQGDFSSFLSSSCLPAAKPTLLLPVYFSKCALGLGCVPPAVNTLSVPRHSSKPWLPPSQLLRQSSRVTPKTCKSLMEILGAPELRCSRLTEVPRPERDLLAIRGPE